MLCHHGFLIRDPLNKHYRLGPSALELGSRAQASFDLRQTALPVLRQLSRETGETALLTTPDPQGRHSLCLERMESSHSLRMSVEPGRLMPLHAGAMQKVLLAFMDPSEVERVLEQPLERLCTNTITDPERLRRELREIRRRAYASSFEETDHGLWGVAVPILDLNGSITAGVGTAGPMARLTPGEIDHQVACCSRAASTIAEATGLRALHEVDLDQHRPTRSASNAIDS